MNLKEKILDSLGVDYNDFDDNEHIRITHLYEYIDHPLWAKFGGCKVLAGEGFCIEIFHIGTTLKIGQGAATKIGKLFGTEKVKVDEQVKMLPTRLEYKNIIKVINPSKQLKNAKKLIKDGGYLCGKDK